MKFILPKLRFKISHNYNAECNAWFRLWEAKKNETSRKNNFKNKCL